jgi:hypothetical protein
VTDPRIQQLQYQVEHQHSDGSWGQLVEERRHVDSVEHDPERGWALRRIFRCTTCDETVAITPAEDAPSPDAE